VLNLAGLDFLRQFRTRLSSTLSRLMKPIQYQIRTIAIATAVVALFAAVAVWYFDIPHAPVEKVFALHGQTEITVLNKLGDPAHEYTFTMDQPLGEFQIELYNTYPPDSPNNPNVRIRECTWNYSRHRLTVWFHKQNESWIALDTCRYRNGIVF